MNKRGASPLVVTIILIAFAVALGTMIMNLGSQSINLKPTCDNVELSFEKTFGEDTICYDEASLKLRVVLQNSGKAGVDSVLFRHIKANLRSNEFPLRDSELKPADIYDVEIGYELSTKTHIEFIPVIKTGEGTKKCADKALVVEGLKPCPSE